MVAAVSEYRFSRRSYTAMAGVRPELIAVATRALSLSPIDFVVTEGLRSEARQRELVRIGASKTMRSRHLTGHAIDVGAWHDGAIRWDWSLYLTIADAFRIASAQLGVPLEWGGTWRLLSETPDLHPDMLHKRFPDGPHYQLPWEYQ